MVFEKLDDMKTFLGYDSFPKQMSQIFESFYDRNIVNFMDETTLKATIDRLKIDSIDFEPLIFLLNQIHQNQKLLEGLSFIQYAMIIGAHPSAWLIKHGPRLNNKEFKDQAIELLIILSLIQPSMDSYQERKIDMKHAEFNLGHLKNYIKNYIDKYHEFGIEPFGWTSYLASLGLIQLQSLNFMHHMFSDPYCILVHKTTSETIVLVNQVLSINQFGQFSGVNQVKDVAFQTVYQSSDEFIYGNPVNSRGLITKEPIRLDLNQWKIVVKYGDPVIDFHIPTGVAYDVESIKETFKSGKMFFQKHYPDYDYQAFWCVSWLYAPQLPHIITKPNSKILEIQKQGYICPATPGESSLFNFVFKHEKPDFTTLVPQTSLEKDVVQFIKRGGKVNAGLYVYLFKDIDAFGQIPYQKSHEQEAFDQIKPYQEVL